MQPNQTNLKLHIGTTFFILYYRFFYLYHFNKSLSTLAALPPPTAEYKRATPH